MKLMVDIVFKSKDKKECEDNLKSLLKDSSISDYEVVDYEEDEEPEEPE